VAATEAASLADAPPDLAALVADYWYLSSPDDVLDRSEAELVGAAASQRRLAQHRPPNQSLVRARVPSIETDGYVSARTVIEVVTDDMPFLVDSVSSELARQGRGILLVVHPIVAVRRDASGELTEIVEVDPRDHADVPDDAIVESWMHFEVERTSEPAVLHDIEQGIRDVLRDVRSTVEDWPAMRDQALKLAFELEERPPAGVDADKAKDAGALLRWLAQDHFTFMGYREYTLTGPDDDLVLSGVPGSGLGVLRPDSQQSRSFSTLGTAAKKLALSADPLVLTKANHRSTVHRRAYLDYVGVKVFNEQGKVIGERRFVGLYTASAYTGSVFNVPVVARKVEEVIERSELPLDGHSGKDLEQFLETYPRDELFQASVDDLLATAMAVQQLQERRLTRAFFQRDPYGRFMSVLVYLPRDRYTTGRRLLLEQILRTAFGAESVDYDVRLTTSVLARLHFVVRVPTGHALPDVDTDAIELELAAAARSWEDALAEAFESLIGEERGAELNARWADAYPEAYKEDFDARVGVIDADAVERLHDGEDFSLNLYPPNPNDPNEFRLKVYRKGSPVNLSEILPVLERMGARVSDERPYGVEPLNAPPAWIYDFGMHLDGPVRDPESLKKRFESAFGAVWSGKADNDQLNALVVRAGLSWRQVVVVRAYVRWLRQTGLPYGLDFAARALVTNSSLARSLVELFETRFDPEFDDNQRAARQEAIVASILTELDEVAALDEDRLLRAILVAMQATLRTNLYRTDTRTDAARPLALKIDPKVVPGLPSPRPKFEVWVHGPGVEGVHLRFGAVARGGLRWSDRREDFRTEVLGLVKAQMVKNSVIVPVGAKGGFVVRREIDPGDREATIAAGIESYRSFVSALLDVTDNLVGGAVVPPPDVVRHDADDTYLVVAADKGTATFSDIANAVASDYGFWLDDAFASGGSAGYDHKAMGITARGAWESVRRHFRELGIDVQSDPVTVVGVGDMSGDVFGNGMMLSESLKLVAAFDHRHIFLDPNPDPAVSFAERQRVAALPRSSWADYNSELISAGGGVYPRTLKSIPVSAEVAEALGIEGGATHLAPFELMRSILKAPVDLLWNGGIGTYVKSDDETDAEVGDKANDSLRINGADLRVRVVGEGGNLGFTQAGRVEAAMNGIHINTDAIDNSAGVDTSDHEVNIKVLVSEPVRDGSMTRKQRDELLASMTDDVAAHVLNTNYQQNIVLGNARVGAPAIITVHHRLIRWLEQRGFLDRAIEGLPSDDELALRRAEGRGLTSPELSVLLAWVKIALTEDVDASDLPDDPWTTSVLQSYFPPAVLEEVGDRVLDHPLRRQIVTMSVVNEMVNRGGITFAYRILEETGASADDIIRAYIITRDVFELQSLWTRIEALDGQAPCSAQTALLLEARRLLDRGVRWLVAERPGGIDVDVERQRLTAAVQALAPAVPSMLMGAEQERLVRRTAEFVELGAPEELSAHVASLLDVFALLDVADLAARSGEDPRSLAELYFALSERYQVDLMLGRITALRRDDRWTSLARSALRADLYSVLADLTTRVAAATPAGSEPLERVEMWESANQAGLARVRTTLADVALAETFDLATLSVVLRSMRQLTVDASAIS
jgi:glutamate dehydrogenase